MYIMSTEQTQFSNMAQIQETNQKCATKKHGEPSLGSVQLWIKRSHSVRFLANGYKSALIRICV